MFLANAAAIVVLWLNGGGVSGVHHLGDLLTSLGRITGLFGAYLLLIQVLLLARLTVLERLTGFDRLTVWHRRNGKLALYLVLAHVVLITVGYALTDRLSIPAEASQLLGSYPGMVTATVGTGLLVLVMLTSLVVCATRRGTWSTSWPTPGSCSAGSMRYPPAMSSLPIPAPRPTEPRFTWLPWQCSYCFGSRCPSFRCSGIACAWIR